MITDDVGEFLVAAPNGPLMGLDLGTKTIGVAISDVLRAVGSPHQTIKRTKFTRDAAILQEIAQDRSVCGIVLGLPRNMDGTEGPRAQSTRAFARNLAPVIHLPICFWDERLSTVAAERALLDADASRRKRADVIDNIAAAYILQGFLDRLAHMGNAHV